MEKISGKKRESMVKNFRKLSLRKHRQYRPAMLTQRGWIKLTPEVVIDMLAGAGTPARPQARQLLVQMQQFPWSARATLRQGGADHASDLMPHITLETRASLVHLRCQELGGLHVARITPAEGSARRRA